MTDNLGAFFQKDEQPEVAETPETPEAVETPEVEAAKPQQPRGPDGKFAPKGETEAAPPAAEEQTGVPVKALQEERRKRQELEAELQRLREQAAQQPPQPAPEMFEDPEGWQQHFGTNVVSEAVSAATMNARLDMSEMMVRQAQPDFEDKKAAFLEMMRETPGLQQKALADPHPWQFAYNYVTNRQRMDELAATNVTELEAKLREQIAAEMAAKQPAPETPEIPESLADQQSARGSAPALSVKSLDEILNRRR